MTVTEITNGTGIKTAEEQLAAISQSIGRNTPPPSPAVNPIVLSIIIMFCEDDAHLLSGAIESCPNHPAVEIIAVGTRESKEFVFGGITIEEKPNGGGFRLAEIQYTELNFSNLRNKAATLARGKWIFMLDADERFGFEAQHEGFINSLAQQPDYVGAQIVNIISQGHDIINNAPTVATTMTAYCRLYRNIPAIQYRNFIHETIEESVREAGLKIFPTFIILLHWGYDSPPAQRMKKCQRNLSVAARELLSPGLQPHRIETLMEIMQKTSALWLKVLNELKQSAKK